MSEGLAGPKSGWMLNATIAMSGMAISMAYSVVGPVLPQISAELAHDAGDAYRVKLIAGLVGAAAILGAPAAGRLSDSIGRRSIFAGAAALYTIAGCAPIFLNNLTLILFSRACLGFAASAIATMGVAMVSDHFAEGRREKWLGVVVACAMLANLVFVPIAGLLGEAGWRAAFCLYLVGVPLGLFAWFGVKGSEAPRIAPPHAASPPGPKPPWRIPYGLLLLALATGGVIYVPVIYLSFRLREIGFAGSTQIGLLLTVEAIFGVCVALTYGRARKLLSASAAFLVSFSSIACGMLLIALNDNYPAVILGLVMWGVGLGWLSPNILAYASALADESSRGRVIGLAKAALSVAPLVGVSLLEPVSARYGASGVLIVVAALAALLVVWATSAEIRRAGALSIRKPDQRTT